MRRPWVAPVLAAFVLGCAPTSAAWAQQAGARQETGLFVWLLILAPVAVLLLVTPAAVRAMRRNVGQVDRSLQMAEEHLQLTREQLALQKETNRLLGELLEAVKRR